MSPRIEKVYRNPAFYDDCIVESSKIIKTNLIAAEGVAFLLNTFHVRVWLSEERKPIQAYPLQESDRILLNLLGCHYIGLVQSAHMNVSLYEKFSFWTFALQQVIRWLSSIDRLNKTTCST